MVAKGNLMVARYDGEERLRVGEVVAAGGGGGGHADQVDIGIRAGGEERVLI